MLNPLMWITGTIQLAPCPRNGMNQGDKRWGNGKARIDADMQNITIIES